MKIFASVTSLALNVFVFLSALTFAVPATTSSSRPRINTQSWDIKEEPSSAPTKSLQTLFRVVFGQTHQRLFFATLAPQKNASGVLTQESRTGHTASSIGASKAKNLARQLSNFTTVTKYAQPGKYWSCHYPLDFTFAEKTTLRRCREMLTPEHKKAFSQLVSTLSLESKR